VVYLISDLHGEKDFKGLDEYINTAGDNDLLIILGDICMKFMDTEKNRAFTEYFLSIKNNIAIVDGNHENFAYIDSFPEEEWNGGTIHRLTDSIIHLKRGNVFEIEGKTFFVFGGCKSSSRWAERGLWYFGEEATDEECEYAKSNLKRYGNKVDFILTHKYEEESCKTICQNLLELTSYIEHTTEYGSWYSGHWHINKQVDEKHFLVYDELTRIC